ncbi:cell division protein FtsK [Catellatospora methionotrophica]|uniref:Cell division protein FtsK n=1 Tax=Catellatospora methionotrophica TaxID=121620 RepID=A0A8J3L6U4_9ACTN|nr:FtsK/SpoIIIE domain-containing protein [Catellatospora methionotrophica]GIG15462.1 cell division protein FtsK [Catellatospora methionotrophica]
MTIDPDTPVDWDAELADLVEPTPVDTAGDYSAPKHADRQPILPKWLRSTEAFKAQMRWAAENAAHRAGYHAVRLPLYATRLIARSPRGLGRVLRGWLAWMLDWDGRQVVRSAVAVSGDGMARSQYVTLADERGRRVGARLRASGLGVLVAGAGGVAVLASPAWVQLLTAGLAVASLGAVGGRPDAPLASSAVVTSRVARLHSETVQQALLSIGIAGINRAPKSIGWPAPIQRDGAGWRAEVDLPPGVTAGDVIERREALASALSRPLGCVWPEGAPSVHPGRLVLWVGDREMSKSPNPPWPLAKAGRVNLFEPFAFGTDPRGRAAPVTLMYASAAIGSIPRMGKTFSLRLLLLAACLDLRAQVWAFDLKGTGDFRPLQPVAHRYRAGDDGEDIEYALAALSELHTEMGRRTRVLRGLPSDLVPESKVTDQLADNTQLGLCPVVVGVDECQRWFEHPEHGEAIQAICEDLVRRGPAVGIMMLFATQRPDAKSLPPVISSNVVLRYAMKVMTHTANDMILGSGASSSGIKAHQFARSDRGIGYLAGEGDDPQIVRTHYVDAVVAEQVVTRARAAREAAGTLSGYALGVEQDVQAGPSHDVLADVLSVIADKAWLESIAERLAELRPAYEGWDKTNVSAALRPYGIVPAQTWLTDSATGKGANRYGVTAEAIRRAIAERDGKRRK